MGKGFAISTVLGLIIAAIILFVFAPMLFGAAKDVWATIAQSLGIIKLSNIEQAILCSYYRCVEGCVSIRMEEIKWTSGKETIGCQKFCQLPCTDQNAADCFTDTKKLTVCNDKSVKFPVNITLSSAEEISKKHLETWNLDCGAGFSYGVCINGETTLGDVINFNGGCPIDIERIKNILYGEKEVCKSDVTGLIRKDGWKTVKITNPGEYFIFSLQIRGIGTFNEIKIMSKDEYKNVKCMQHDDKNKCEAANCQWCPNCVNNQANQFVKDICISKTETCQYQKYCGCSRSGADCAADADCSWCSEYNQCMGATEYQTMCPAPKP